MDSLGDDLVLLSINPDSGRIRTARKIDYGLMGSELVRLAASGRVDIEAGRIVVRNPLPTGDAELDVALASIAEARRPPKADRWVGHPRHGICRAYLERLNAAGVVRKESALLTRWRIARPQLVADARARLDAIAVSTAPLDLAQSAYGGLAHAIGLDAELYRGWGNRGIRRRFEQIAKGRWTAPRASDPGADLAADGPGEAMTAEDPGGPIDHAAHDRATHAPSDSPSGSSGHGAAQGAAHAATHAAAQGATHAATQSAAHAATQGAVNAATQAAMHAATQAAVHAATHAAVHAATQAAVDASVSSAHSGAAGGGHAGH